MEPDYIKQKALIRILDDDEALGAALKLYLELDGLAGSGLHLGSPLFCRRSSVCARLPRA